MFSRRRTVSELQKRAPRQSDVIIPSVPADTFDWSVRF